MEWLTGRAVVGQHSRLSHSVGLGIVTAGEPPAPLESSISRRIDGVQVSSYCPDRTDQTNPTRNPAAITMVKRIRRKMTVMTEPPQRPRIRMTSLNASVQG